MVGYRTSRKGQDNLIKAPVLIDQLLYHLDQCAVRARVCNEDAFAIDIGSIPKSVLNILTQRFFKAPPVLFPHIHFSVYDFNAGLQLQQICPKRRNRRASAALMQVFERIDYKACLYLWNRFQQRVFDFLGSICRSAISAASMTRCPIPVDRFPESMGYTF